VSDGPAAADHLSLDALAELEEGIAEDADALRRHLDNCPTCTQRAGQLHASRALLSALPPDPMPADVAARIDAALAAEPAPATTFASGGNIVPLRGRRPWWHGPNLAAAAAGIAVLALGTALAVGHLGGSKSPNSEATDKGANSSGGPLAGANAPAPLKQWQTGYNYTTGNRAGYVTGLVLGDPPPFSAVVTGAGPRPSPRPVNSRASYTRDDLREPANLAACAALLAGHPVQPVAADYARYDGAAAVIVVLPGLRHPESNLDVYVIRSTCSDAAADISYFSVPRPR
jgi:hypothetical protein